MTSRLSEQLNYLLLLHNYVVLPQLGGFVRELLPASYHRERGVAYPPTSELHFNTELSHSDGLLEERYALLLGVSLRRARLVLEEDIRLVRQGLLHRGEYLLEGLGTLRLSAEGQLLFDPQAHPIVADSSSYGLSPVSLPELVRAVNPSEYAARVSEGGHSASDDEAVTAQSTSTHDSRYLNLRLSKRMLGYAAVVIAFVVALLPWGGRVASEPHYQASFIPSAEVAERLFGVQPADPTAVDTAETSAAPVLVTRSVGMPWLATQDGRYHLIIATDRDECRLEHYYEAARELFPEAELVAMKSAHSRMCRLSLRSFATSAEAYQALNNLVKAHPQYRTAWIYLNE